MPEATLHLHLESCVSLYTPQTTIRYNPKCQYGESGDNEAVNQTTNSGMTIEIVGDDFGSDGGTNCLVDIVAVHGLYEDHNETWTDPESRVSWLRDLLPSRLSQARILTYGYKAEALASSGEGSSDRILSHALTLVAELYATRDLSNTISRPIIFICHGLGGILVKRALALSNTSSAKQVQHRRSIFTATYAIMFFGTPHAGMSDTALRANALLRPMAALSQLSSALARGSQILQDINDQFAPLTKKFSIYLFWEQLESDFGSTNGYVVSQDSADPGWETAERAGIHANHSHMCKFTAAHEDGFKLVLSACRRYVQKAPQVVLARWNEDRSLIERERKQEAAELLRHDSGLSAYGGPSPTRNVHYIVPRSASSLFTGRANTANLLRQRIVSTPYVRGHHQHKIFVIWGLGGSGKTQFCLKFVEDNQDSFWGVFWIDATTDATAEMGFAELGGIAKKDTTFAAGMHWLSNCQEPWLLVLDNADNHEMDVSRYFPAGGRGHIILTTRNPNNVVHATIDDANFREMEEEDAITLLLKAAQQPGAEDWKDIHQRQLAKPITSALGYLAIAIIHAGATIRRRLYTLESYLRVYERELMNCKLLPSSNKFERSITTTYEIPFTETMQRTDQAAIDATQILQIFVFFHFQKIPAAMFRRAWSNLQNAKDLESKQPRQISSLWSRSTRKHYGTEDEVQSLPSLLHQTTWDDRRLHDALAVLYDLSFIYYDNAKQMCWMHPMIRLWGRSRLPPEEQKHWLQMATNLLANSISPTYEPAGREFRRSLVPHIAACLNTRNNAAQPIISSNNLYRDLVAERFAAVYSEIGDWKMSREIYERVLSTRKKEIGPEHPETLRAMVELGKVYWDLFDVRNAIQIRVKVCEIRTKTLGEDDPLTLSSISDLTATYWLAGNRIKSLNYGEKAASGLSTSLGLDDPITLTAIFHLARTQFHLGYVEKARLGLEQVLKARKTFFGTKHPDTLMAMAELGIVYHSLRNIAAAEKLLLEVLNIRKETLGEEHPYTLWTVNDLCKVYTDSGRAKLALEMLDAMIPVVVRTLGHRHVGMNMTKFNLARAYNALGRWADGEKVLVNQIGHLVSSHPDYMVAITELAWIYKNLKRFGQAVDSYLKALDAITDGLPRGVNQALIGRVGQQLEETYIEMGQSSKIDDLKKRIAELTRRE